MKKIRGRKSRETVSLRIKRQCTKIVDFCFFHQTTPPRSVIHAPKYYRISLRICRDINKYVWSCAMLHSAGPWSRAMLHIAGLSCTEFVCTCRARPHSAGSVGQTLDPCCMTSFIVHRRFFEHNTYQMKMWNLRHLKHYCIWKHFKVCDTVALK
jgi:hypothetical protein